MRPSLSFASCLLSAIVFSSLCAVASLSFAEGGFGTITFTLGESNRVENVIFCENKDTALSLAKQEAAFLEAKKPLKDFYDEIRADFLLSECGMVKSNFVLLRVVHSYVGYNSNDLMEPLRWSVVEVEGDIPGLEKKLYLFIPSKDIH